MTATNTSALDRFTDIYHALESERRWWKGPQRLRYAAMAAIMCEGHPTAVAKAMRRTAKTLSDESPWHWGVNANVQLIVAALLVQRGDSAKRFLKELVRVRGLFRQVRLHRALQYELLAVLILRIQADGGTIRAHTITRFRSIYDEMKRHHRFLTGADDFPACALLTGQSGTPRAMLEKVEAIYGAMRAHKFAMGDALQTAANIMYLADGAPRAVASRAAALRDEFRSHKVRIQQRDYDELAILSILDLPAHRIVPRVLDVRESLGAIRPRIDAATRFDVAVGITFLELAARDGRTAAVSGAKVLMDMQAVVAAQQAMLAAAAAAGAASAASSGGGS